MKQYAVRIQVVDIEANSVPIDHEMWVVAPDEVMALTSALVTLAEQEGSDSVDRVMNTIQLASR